MKISRITLPASLLILLITLIGYSQPHVTTTDIENSIKEEIPVGSAKSKVFAFLDARRIEHSSYIDNEKAILAIVHDTSSGFLTKGDIQIKFIFDVNENLESYTIKEIFTGP